MAEHQEPGSARAGIAAPAGAPEDPGREARAPESRRFRLLREAFLRAARRGSAVERERVEEAFAGQGLSEDDMVQLHDMLESVLGQVGAAA